MPFNNWRKRLEIAEKYSTVAGRRAAIASLGINCLRPDYDDEGYYRKPITVKDESGNGRNVITGWIPVSYFLHSYGTTDTLVGLIGAGADQRNMTDHELQDEELWSYVVSNPISYEVYEAVADRGEPWPDQPMTGTPDLVDGGKTSYSTYPDERRDRNGNPRTIERTDNLPPTVDPLTEHKEAIENATKAALSTYKEITSNEMDAQAEGAKNRIAELRLAADKAGRAIYEPMYREYQKVQKAWTPSVKMAVDAEDILKQRILTWREKERKRIAAEQAEADHIARAAEAERVRLAAEEEERQQRAADRAIAAGEPEPEPEPVVVEPEPPVVVEVPVVVPPTPPRPTYGTRTTKAEMKTFLDQVTDWDAVYGYFKNTTEVKTVLTVLATAAIRAGDTIPGTTTREGLI